MNKFRNNLHSALFDDGIEKVGISEKNEKEQQKEVIKETKADTAELKENILQSNLRRNNESLASSVIPEMQEELKTEEQVSKQLEKQLEQLAKNKKIDFPWTDNAWKCSKTEKSLATSSAKVFQQLLDVWILDSMIKKCKDKKGDLTDLDAENWKSELWINSKIKDIQRFYEAYKEYQNPQSEYQHLKNLMWFFCESGFENRDWFRNAMKRHSQKISKADIKKWRSVLWQEWWVRDSNWNERYVIIDTKTWKEIDKKPRDWKERAKFEIIKDRLKDNQNSTDKTLTILWDFNLDGEVNSWDTGYKTWSQIADVFRRTVATKHLEDEKFDDNAAVKNLVEYANGFGMDIQNVDTVDQFYQWMTGKNWYDNTKNFQNFIRNLPIELWDVLENWQNAWKKSLDSISSVLKIEAQEREAVENAAKEKAQEFVNQYEPLLQERIKDATKRANITQQLLSQLPGVLMNEAQGMKQWLGVWASIPLDEIIRWLSLWLKLWVDKNWKPHFGIYWARDRNFLLWKWFDVSTWASVGLNSFMIPCESIFAELGYDLNEKRRKESLDAMWIDRVSLWANCTMYWAIFSWGVSAWFEQNKQGWIEKQAKNINGQIKSMALDLVNAIKNKVEWQSDAEVLKTKLKGQFPKSSEEEIESATNTILQIIKPIIIDEDTKDRDNEINAQVIADVYTEMWRGDALSWIADSKWKLSWWKVWIQFLAWFFPTTSLVAKFTKYYNARTNETEHSRIARIDAQVSWVGNKLISMDWKEIWAEKVSQINDVLKRYGTKSELSYINWSDWKLWRIQVPVSMSDGIWVNVRISESLKWYVKKESDWSYSFPANAIYRLLQETGWDQRSITLNIGSDKSATSDVIISDVEWMENLLWDKELMGSKKLEYRGPRTESIEYNPDIDSLFTTDVVEGLKRIDSTNRRKFSEFMWTKTDANRTFDEMVVALQNVLWKNKKYEKIMNELSIPHEKDWKVIVDVATRKQLIIDRIMAISADANVHNESWLRQNLKQRWDYYKRESMKGPNGQSIFGKLNVNRDDLIRDLDNYNPEFKSNILWATAFYNRNNSAKWLALTWLWSTNVFWGKTHELTGEDKINAEKRFLWDSVESNYIPWVLEKSPAEWSNLKRALNGKLPEGASLSDENLKKLLRWEETEINIDNSQKKAKIKLDTKYVFYLMWECANESVGIELWNLTIQEQQEVDDYAQWLLYLNNGDGSSAVSVSRKDFAAGVSLWGQKKKKEESKPDWDSTPGEKEEPIDPDWDSQPWEKEEPINNDWNSNPGQTPWEWTGGTPEVGWEWNSGSQWWWDSIWWDGINNPGNGWESNWWWNTPWEWGENKGWWADNNQNGWPKQWGEGQSWWWSGGRD